MSTRHNESGQAVVETVLMLPFLLMLVMVLAEFGFAFYSYIVMNNAAAEAARFAALGKAPSSACAEDSIQWRAEQMSNGLVGCNAVTTFAVTYQGTEPEPERGSAVSVLITREHNTVTPLPALISFVTGGTFPVTWKMAVCSDARLESNVASAPSGTYELGAGSCAGD